MAIFEGLSLFNLLTEEEQNYLESFCQEKYVKGGDFLFKEGDEANSMYVLKGGSIEVSQNIDGVDINIGTVVAEEIIGEMALFGFNQKRMATAKAITDCQLITILSFSIKELADKNPELLEKIKNIISKRITSNKLLENKVREGGKYS